MTSVKVITESGLAPENTDCFRRVSWLAARAAYASRGGG